MDLQRPGQISEPDDVTKIVRAPRPWERGGAEHVRRTTLKGVLVLVAILVPVTFAGLAFAGVLPDAVQRPVSNAAGKVGLSVPNPDDDIEMALNRDALAKTTGSSGGSSSGKKSSGSSGSGVANAGGGSKGGGSAGSAGSRSAPTPTPSAGPSAGGASPSDIVATPDSGICSVGAPTGTTLNEYCGGANTGTSTGVAIERSTTSSTKVDNGTPPASTSPTAPPGSLPPPPPPSTTAPRPPTTVTAPPPPPSTKATTTTAPPKPTTTRRRR